MRVVAIIQARMGSTRLPGKVLRDLDGKTVLAHVVERTMAGAGLGAVVVATTTRPADDAVQREALLRGALVFRGSEDDVLGRYAEAARQHGAEAVVRVTADCPLLDPQLMSEMIGRFVAAPSSGRRIDYLSNTVSRTFPRGLDVEIFGYAALARAHREALESQQREHVTPYIWQHPEMFELEHFRAAADHSALRWTLDTEEDWIFLNEVFRSLRQAGVPATTAAVLGLLEERPELQKINAHVKQKAIEP